MRDLKRGLFEDLEITFPLDVDKRVNYMQRLLKRLALNKYKTVLSECKASAKVIAGDQWTLSAKKYVIMEKFRTWEKLYSVEVSGDMYLGAHRLLDFEKEIWFELGKIIWKKHRSVLQDHIKYIHNENLKPFRVFILQYAKSAHEMHDI